MVCVNWTHLDVHLTHHDWRRMGWGLYLNSSRANMMLVEWQNCTWTASNSSWATPITSHHIELLHFIANLGAISSSTHLDLSGKIFKLSDLEERRILLIYLTWIFQKRFRKKELIKLGFKSWFFLSMTKTFA